MNRNFWTCTASLATLIFTTNASAQTSADDEQVAKADRPYAVDDIIVTARKREETILNVPVVATALRGETLAKLEVSDLSDMATLVPGLTMGESVTAVGMQVSIRGVGTIVVDPGVDQSVSLNIDGLQFSQGIAYMSGMFDVGQVEVLKGPQSLFFGKSSPGGVISLRTADPTDEREIVVRAGFEPEAREIQSDLIISGPVTDRLKLRLAGRHSNSDGYFKNPAVALAGSGALNPADRRLSGADNWMVRATALWEPTSDLTARLKFNVVDEHITNPGTSQYISCPDGTGAVPPFSAPFLGGGEDCKLDSIARITSMDPAIFTGIENGGHPFMKTKLRYGTLELNYVPSDALTITSLTGWYDINSQVLTNIGGTTFAGPTMATFTRYGREEFAQELRLNTSFDGPLNATLGAFYQHADVTNINTQRGNPLYRLPPLRGRGVVDMGIETYSLFGQLRWMVVPELELAAGARWTDETRTVSATSMITGILPTPTDITVARPRISSGNLSPEFTATYRPNDNLTVFAAYKRGNKSGSFNITTAPVAGQDISFDDEKVEGGEIGVKGRLFDRQLAVSIAAYDYRYEGLQVGGTVEGPGGTPISKTLNAGKARVYGIDLDGSFQPRSISGLNVRFGVNWNHSEFVELNGVPCTPGQTVSEGCNQVLNPVNGRFTAQSLDGSPLIRAPRWQGSLGFDYEISLTDGLTLTLVNNNNFSSRYLTFLGTRNDFFQPKFAKVDLGLSVSGPRNRWEFSVTGRNIFDKLTTGNCSAPDAQGGVIAPVSGTPLPGPAGTAEVACRVDRGRAIWLTATLRPFN